MQSVNLTDLEYYGKVSAPPSAPRREAIDCLGCGSSLAGRSKGIKTWGGKLVQVFGCRCGRDRHVEVAAR